MNYTYIDGYTFDIFIDGDYAFVTNNNSGLIIYNISDPTNPSFINNSNIFGNARGVHVNGDYAYIADKSVGLVTIQIRLRNDMKDPIITDIPSDLTLDEGYSSQIFSWTVNDTNPDRYMIELVGNGTIIPSLGWLNNEQINYTIPEDLDVGTYIYSIHFMDKFGHIQTDNVSLIIQDTIAPRITIIQNDMIIDEGYSDKEFSWIVVDAHPFNYTIELIGEEIVVPSTSWTSNSPIGYTIPENLTPGDYQYNITFYDEYGNYYSYILNLHCSHNKTHQKFIIKFEIIRTIIYKKKSFYLLILILLSQDQHLSPLVCNIFAHV